LLFIDPLGITYFFYPLNRFLMFTLIIAGIVLLVKSSSGKPAAEEKPEPVRTSRAAAKSAPKMLKGPAKAQKSFEEDIGKKWLPRIGIISIVLGIAFFVIYAIQNRWIGPTGQVALGVIAGIAVIAAGEFFDRKGYHNYAMTLAGGGFAIIYFAMFAAYRFYGLLPLTADVIALTAVIAGAVFFSIRYDSAIIAAEAFFLGYIVPLLTSSVNTFFLIYAVALTAGLTFLTTYKNWKTLGAAGIVAMYVTHLLWIGNYSGSRKDIMHLIFIAIYLAMFTVMAFRFKESAKERIDSLVSSRNVIGATLIVTYLMLFLLDFSKAAIIITPLLLLLLTVLFMVLKFRWSFFAIGSILLTYLVHWSWLDRNLGPSTLLVNFLALMAYFLLFNAMLFLSYDKKSTAENVIGMLANSAAYYFINMAAILEIADGYKGIFTAGLSIFYLIGAYISYGKKISPYFNTSLVLCFGYLALAVPLQFNEAYVSISWAALTLILVILAFRLKENIIRISSSVLGAITLARLIFYDSWALSSFNASSIFDSTRLFSFLAAIIIFYAISGLYYRNRDKFANFENSTVAYVTAAYSIAATALTTVIMWLEIWDLGASINEKKLWTSLAFVIQAILILGFGFMRQIRLFRLLGLILFGLAIFKVFIYDLSNLETGFRIISFIVLGVLALAGAFLYNKYKDYL